MNFSGITTVPVRFWKYFIQKKSKTEICHISQDKNPTPETRQLFQMSTILLGFQKTLLSRIPSNFAFAAYSVNEIYAERLSVVYWRISRFCLTFGTIKLVTHVKLATRFAKLFFPGLLLSKLWITCRPPLQYMTHFVILRKFHWVNEQRMWNFLA